jgi:hypothetical protein
MREIGECCMPDNTKETGSSDLISYCQTPNPNYAFRKNAPSDAAAATVVCIGLNFEKLLNSIEGCAKHFVKKQVCEDV